MTVIDTDTARLLRDAARKHAERSHDVAALRARRGTLQSLAPGHLDTLRAQGWLDAFVPEDCGGMGLDLTAAAALVQELAPAFGVAPLDSHFLACRALTQSDAWAGLGEMDAVPVLALAFQERAGDLFDPAAAQTVLDADGRLTGVKCYVAGLDVADLVIVTAQGADGLTLAAVDPAGKGVHCHTRWRADGTPMGELHLTSAPARVLASGAHLPAALVAAVDQASLLVAVELMAHVDAMMTLLLEHLRRRVQFGQPIGAFQALQHRAADLHVRQLLSRAALDAALPALEDLPTPAARALRVARVRSRLNNTARLTAREGIQMFGAMGITDECDLGLHVKRVLALTGWLGTETQHRHRAATILAAQLAKPDTQTQETRP